MSRILMVEDEPALLDSYCEIIKGLGAECISARDGNEALALARQHQPDLVVTDYMMPGMSGVELIRRLKSDVVLSPVPVILLSAGRPSEADRREAWQFLPKPVTVERLERSILEALRHTKESGEQQSFVSSATTEVSPLTLAREEMLSWVSHEIKSPLSAALTACQLAMRSVKAGEPAQQLERRLSTIARQLARMDELATSILDAAQIENGRLRLEVTELDVGEWLKGVTAFWQELQPDHVFELNDGQHAKVEGDPERLRQVLDNLISNAIKYGHPSKRIRVDVTLTQGNVLVSVIDEGRGIAPEELPSLFNKFHRVEGQGGRGHGLGLYIANALCRLHGGTITVESSLDKGSKFTVVLPRKA